LNRLTCTACMLLALAAAPAVAQGDRRGRASAAELGHQVDQVAAQVKNAEDVLRVVETQYIERAEPSPDDLTSRRYSDGEIQYLLGDWRAASVLFYDLVSDPAFRNTPRFPEALFYLADALYQQGNFIGARLYLRELLGLRTRHYRDALTRYLEIAGRLNELSGIDDYISQARGLSGGQLPPELAYVYGKWLFKRRDLPQAERLERARAVFEPLAAQPGALRLQSAYFLGVALVQERRYEEAVERFRGVVQAAGGDKRDRQVRELANLSLGRLLYETGRYSEAIDRYQEIPRESPHFVEALYEIAWSQVRREEFEKAKNATDILLLVAPDSTLAPEAKILQGHLLLKLKRYDHASEAYGEVINDYGPVRDEVDAQLRLHKDPVAYFDNVLARNERNLDVTQLLPPVALKWATTQREVSDAVRIVDDLEAGRRGVTEGRDIAGRILAALDERGMETFPELQEGYTRADAVDSALTRAEESLVRLEGYLLRDLLSAEDRAELDALREQKAAAEKRFAELPTTTAELEARRRKLQDRVDGVDKQAFRLGYEVQSLNAVTVGIEQWVAGTRQQRKNTPEEEKAFLEQLQTETAQLAALERELDTVRKALKDQRELVDAAVGGEGRIRREYDALLERERKILARAEPRVSPEGAAMLARAARLRTDMAPMRDRVGGAKAHLHEQVTRRGAAIRAKVLTEQRLLEEYAGEVVRVSGDTRQLVGTIAFASFQRVRQQFYDLVLKADVGVVDVAFTRKQDKTHDIQRLSQQKDRELRALDEEFREVLTDVD
jgi:tetratricopeptide (TPR) repeat protein